MLQTLQDKYEELTTDKDDVKLSPTDARNAGISQAEAGIAFVAALGAGYVARELLRHGWQVATKKEPPMNPASHEVAWKDALVWGAISGAVAGMVRIASRRASTATYRNFKS